MSQFLFANNGLTTLGSNLGSGATTLTVASGTGNDFPSPAAGQVVALTIIQAGSTTGVPNEIVYATARTGDTFTVLRGQEGTTAQAWSTGDTVANMATAYFYDQQATGAQIQQQAGNFADDTGAANAGVASLSPVPANLAALVGVPIRILKMGNSNTGSYTLNINGFGPEAVTLGGVSLTVGQLLRNQIFEVMWDGSNFELLSAPGNVANGNLAVMAANTVKANITGSSANPTDVTIASLLSYFGNVAQILNTTEAAFSIPVVLSGAIVNLEFRCALITLEAGGSETNTAVTFPEPFSTHCIGVLASQASRASPSWSGLALGTVEGSVTVDGCTISADTCNTANGQSGALAFYIAIGY